MKRNWYGSIGSISSGTMREKDLILSFLWEAKNLRLTKDERKEVSAIQRRSTSELDYKTTNGERCDYWESETASFDLDALFDILDNHSLPYFCFQSSEGDGACFGWWLDPSFEDEFDGLKVSDTSEVPKGYAGEVLHVNDHGNMTLYSARNGRLHEVWGIV